MGFLAQLFREHIERVDRAGFFEHLFLVLWFRFIVAGTMVILLAALVWIVWSLHDWWYGIGGDGAAVAPVEEELVAPPEAHAPISLAEAEQAARSVRRRHRAARDSAPGEPGSSTSDATELEGE